MWLLRRPGLALGSILAVYLLLLLPTVPRQGVNWDERTDLTIAEVYSSSLTVLLYGTRDDAVNTRLPMYSVAMLFRLSGEADLQTARLASCVVGVLTIIAVFLFCSRELDRSKALVAAAILATSPYYLFFSKTAFTEGDIWVTGTVAWVLVCGSWLRHRWQVGQAALTGIALGLALSAKISAIALLPAFGAFLLLQERRQPEPGAQKVTLRSALFPLAVAILFAVWLILSLILIKGTYPHWGAGVHSVALVSSRLLLVAGLWVAVLVWCYAHRAATASRWTQLLLVLILAAVTFFVVPPVHTTNPWIIGSLLNDFFAAGAGFDWGFFLEAALFHFIVVLLKPSVILGAVMWIALVLAMARFKARSELRLPLLTFLCYVAFILALPWAQTRYMMPVFPILAILAADLFVDLFRSRRSLALTVGTLAVVFLAVDFRLSYPDLNLNGYQWLGERYIGGRASLGYRAVAQIGSDGAEQVLRWAAKHAEDESTVVTFIYPGHIIRSAVPRPHFHLVDGLRESPSLEVADYVLTTKDADIWSGIGDDDPRGEIYRYRYDRRQLEREFVKAFTVERAFGIEVATVWRRKELG
jgi:asparagine N-glycosylation enzyme membrane subunit Stt3